MLRNDVDHLATLRAEYRDQNKAGVVADHRSDPLLATCGSRQPVAADVVVEAGPNALLFFRRGYADPAPQARPAPRFAATRGVSCGMVRDAQFATSAHQCLLPICKRWAPNERPAPSSTWLLADGSSCPGRPHQVPASPLRSQRRFRPELAVQRLASKQTAEVRGGRGRACAVHERDHERPGDDGRLAAPDCNEVRATKCLLVAPEPGPQQMPSLPLARRSDHEPRRLRR